MKLWMKCLSLFCICAGTHAQNGAVCFTFDDYGGENWIKADKIFKKYNAHATFFVMGRITKDKAGVMKKLQAAGHTVALHSVKHINMNPLPEGWTLDTYFEQEIQPQLEDCRKYGIKVRGFAYPNNRRSDETDAYLFKHFDFMRAGWGKTVRPLLMTHSEVNEKTLLPGGGIGTYYKSDIEVLKGYLDQAAEQNALIVFFSHDIYPDATGVHMPTDWLEGLLAHAAKRKMLIIGAEELPKFRGKK